jgi:NAD(P)H dehydrogenase (quinone)
MILVTGASGHLASLVLTHLDARGVTAIGGSRSPAPGHRRLDFDEPRSIDLTDVTTLVLVSAGYAEDDVVIGRHRAVIDAAVRAGVEHVVYTSLSAAGDHLALATAHRATEQLVMSSGLGWTILRNGLYAELFGGLLARTGDGHLESAFGDGALAAVARDDLAESAAIVAADPGAHDGQILDLVGAPVTAADVAGQLGTQHRTISLGDYRARLLGSSELLAFQPPMLLSIATSIRHGFMADASPDLEQLLGRPITDPLAVAAEVVPSLDASIVVR